MLFEYLKKNKLKIFLVGTLFVVFEVIFFMSQGWEIEIKKNEMPKASAANSTAVAGDRAVVLSPELKFQKTGIPRFSVAEPSFAVDEKLDLEASILVALEDVKDPEFDAPITQFTQISVESVNAGTAVIHLGIPSYCPFKDSISQSIKDRLLMIEGIDEVVVLLKGEDGKYEFGENGATIREVEKTVPVMQEANPSAPIFLQAYVKPIKVVPGDDMLVSAEIRDASGIQKVTADMGGIETINLYLTEGDRYEGIWQGDWLVHSTQLKEYVTTITAVNQAGIDASTEVTWFDPAPWWNSDYSYQKQITVTNQTASTLSTGYTVWITLDTAALVSAGKMRSDGEDLRIAYWNGSANVELDRHLRYIDSTSTEVYFKTQADIAGSGNSNNYFIYYGNPDATSAPSNGSNVYAYFTDFDDSTGWSNLTGSASYSEGMATLAADTQVVIYRDTGIVGNEYDYVFEQRMKSDFSDSHRAYWGVSLRTPSTAYLCGNACCSGGYDGYKDLMIVSSINWGGSGSSNLMAVTHDGSAGEYLGRSAGWAPGDDWNVYTQKWRQNEVEYYKNGGYWTTHNVDVSYSSDNVHLYIAQSPYSSYGNALYADWYSVRLLVDTEPTTALGTESEVNLTEFVSIIDPDNGSGTDYTSLSSWETQVQTDLTADSTRVYSHGGITGVIADTDSVTGANSGATGDVVHATSSQILLENISGIFESGEAVEVDGSNYVIISDEGNPAIAVAQCRSTSGTADTTAVTIEGWTTSSSNYIKIWTDPIDAYGRHDGVWDDTKYHFEVTSDVNILIDIKERYVHIDGLQVYPNRTSASQSMIGIMTTGESAINDIKISNCIIRGNNTFNGSAIWYIGIEFWGSTTTWASGSKGYAWNNIVYGFQNIDSGGSSLGEGIDFDRTNGTFYAYNNTVFDNEKGYYRWNGNVIAINNVAQGCGDGYGGTGWNSSSDYNISDISGDAPNATFSGGHAAVSFANKDVDNFHLLRIDPYESSAENGGADLSSDSNLAFSTDIDGDTRDSDGLGWDIGADELPVGIYRSVGPSNTSALDDDDSHGDTVAVSSGAATFTGTTIPDDVGVGDVVIIDTGGTDQTIDSSDTLLFISRRTDSTHYTLQTESGATPADISTNDTWEIYRAYTSLANAEAGTENSTITSTLGFSGFTGGNRDLVTNNEQWNIACYADAADTSYANVDGWITSAQNYIRIHTPVYSSEVGISQRHDGKWNDSAFRLERADVNAIRVASGNVWFDGIQVKQTSSSSSDIATVRMAFADSFLRFSNSILEGEFTGSASGVKGFDFYTGISNPTLEVWNNVFYGYSSPGGSDRVFCLCSSPVGAYLYSNTIVDSTAGFNKTSGSDNYYLKNNIVQNATDGYVGTFNSDSDYNISDISADAPNDTFGGGYATVKFLDEDAGDFHLSSIDTAAFGQGTDLSRDTHLNFTTDIDSFTRARWDIGADEMAENKYKMEGDFQIEGDFKFE